MSEFTKPFHTIFNHSIVTVFKHALTRT